MVVSASTESIAQIYGVRDTTTIVGRGRGSSVESDNRSTGNGTNILGSLSAFSTVLGYVNSGIEGGLGFFGPKGFGFNFFEPYSKGLNKFTKGLIIAGSVLDWTYSSYNNFNNPNYSTGQKIGASIMDAGYYATKNISTSVYR